MAAEEICPEEINIKDEIEFENETLQYTIKIETDHITDADIPYEDVESQVKPEALYEKDNLNIESESTNNNSLESEEEVKTEYLLVERDRNGENLDVKEEDLENEPVEYMEDAGLEGGDETALGHVEACLQDFNIKFEYEGINEDIQREYYERLSGKQERDMTVTETHLISKVPGDSAKTLLEIVPLCPDAELILPTLHPSLEERHQLNSITGNILTLEQEANGLLEVKRDASIYRCIKCTNEYKTKRSLDRHMRVHDGIEKRALRLKRSAESRAAGGGARGDIPDPQPKEPRKVKTNEVKVKSERRKRKSKVTDNSEDENWKRKSKRIAVQESADAGIRRRAEARHVCSCGRRHARRASLRACARQHEPAEPATTETAAPAVAAGGGAQLSCKFCPRRVRSRARLLRHLRLHRRQWLAELAGLAGSGGRAGPAGLGAAAGGPGPCPACGLACGSGAALARHMRLHAARRPHACEFCGFRFGSRRRLRAHAAAHAGRLPYVCFPCEFRCSSAARLARHRAAAPHAPLALPAPAPAAACVVCGQLCESETARLEHERTHPFIEISQPDDAPTRIFFK